MKCLTSLWIDGVLCETSGLPDRSSGPVFYPTSFLISNIFVAGGFSGEVPVQTIEIYRINEDAWFPIQLRLASPLVNLRCFQEAGRDVLVFGENVQTGRLESVLLDTDAFTFRTLPGVGKRLPFTPFFFSSGVLLTFGGPEGRVKSTSLAQRKTTLKARLPSLVQLERAVGCFHPKFSFETVVYGQRVGLPSVDKLPPLDPPDAIYDPTIRSDSPSEGELFPSDFNHLDFPLRNPLLIELQNSEIEDFEE